MKVYLLNGGAGQRIFFSDGVDDEEEVARPWHGGLRGWFEEKLGQIRSRVLHSEAGLALGARRAWQWLQRFTHADERLLVHLRSTPALEIRYPASLDSELVGREWDQYLKSRRVRHLGWLAFNLLLSPISVILAPLPGPNVIGYWFVYRSVHHLLVLLGLRRALKGRIATTWHPSDALDVSLLKAQSIGQPHAELLQNPAHLEGFVQQPSMQSPSTEAISSAREH